MLARDPDDARRRQFPPRRHACSRQSRPDDRRSGCRSAASSAGSAASERGRRLSNPRRSPRRARRARGTARPAARPGPGTARKPAAPAGSAPACARQRLNERADRRPLSSSIGMPRRRVAEHQIGPQLGFDPDREIGTPMVEKPLHGVRQVDGHELMPDAVRQSFGEQPRRATVPVVSRISSAGRCASMRSIRASTDVRFADAGGMDPDQRPARPGSAGDPVALGESARGLPCRAGCARADSTAPAASRRRSRRDTPKARTPNSRTLPLPACSLLCRRKRRAVRSGPGSEPGRARSAHPKRAGPN